jgi:parvulin-like peptidyl-prolyl isomerase
MRRLFLLVVAAPLALLAASCGGGGGSSGSISKNDVAVVAGEHITRDTLDRRMRQAKCSSDLQKRAFPKAGSPEYQSIQTLILQNLVQRVQLQQKAPGLGATVSDKQVEDQLKQLKKQYFGGSEKRYQAELEKQCETDPEVRADIRANLLSAAVYKKVIANVKVTDADANDYYLKNSVNFTQPQTRVVRHILVNDKKTADRIYAQLKGGADFATLARKYSRDPSSKVQGGRLTITRGKTVPEFDQVAFALKTGELAKPVKSQYGWHIIQALKPATPRKATPFAQVKQAIRQQLLQQERSNAVKRWLDGVKAEYASKTTYAAGLAPPPTTTATTTTTG